MKYGYFDDNNREYVITTPETPLPWINYLGNESFFGLMSNTAGGYTFYKDARLRRLTRYRYNNEPLDTNGRYIYLRDDDASTPEAPVYWSSSWQPIREKLDAYECRHGMGYSIIKSEKHAVETSTRYFVPMGQNMEIWQMTITNKRDTVAKLSVFAGVEFCLWDANDDATNFQRNYSIGQVEVVDDVIYHKTEYRERRDHYAYFACSEKLSGFDTQRETFLGRYRGWEKPAAVENGKMSDSIAHGWQVVGTNQVKMALKPGEQKTIVYLLGYHENPVDDKFDPPESQIINKRTVKPVIARFLDNTEVNNAFDELKAYWVELLDNMQVTTPEENTNRMVNIWNAYQVMVTFNMSRSASYFESGIGRGMGFRDSTQDLLGFVQLIPERARERIIDVAATQMENGGAYHQYQPLTKRGNDAVGSGFNDDPLWLVLAVAAYLKETGDLALLDEMVPFDNKAGSEKPLYEHLRRSLQYTLDRLGPHKLPLIGRADWNDCLNLNCFSDTPGQSFQTTTSKDGKVAESVFIAGLFMVAAQEMVQIAAEVKKNDDLNIFNKAAKEMEKAVWAHGWDGAWFRRAYDDFGNPLGSKTCEEGQIFVEPQGLCIMAGLGVDDGRAQQTLDSVEEHLGTPHGLVVLYPAYSSYYLQYGEISSYPQGYKENGSVFCHTNPWIMIGETCIGRGDKAMDFYLRINPSAREEISDVHLCEPYVYAQTIAGKEASTPGEAKNSWLTGTAAWNYVAITQWILGIRPTYNGLMVAPVVPENWQSFTVNRKYRGVRYDIQIERKGKGNDVKLTVDGKAVDGNVIPLPADGTKTVKVDATIG
ncbi:MAG: glycosyl transferase [Anaerolineaceae bacterium]|nr:glycosyl transferase [Anaerolineaceae bacterium]